MALDSECCYAGCTFMLSGIYAECRKLALYAECHYAECRFAECRYAECRGADEIREKKNYWWFLITNFYRDATSSYDLIGSETHQNLSPTLCLTQ
jgi:hypothetical protein